MPITGCYNIDECEEGTAGCDERATCRDLSPGFECKCQDGYQGDGHSCEDVDECLGRSGCDRNAECENNEGMSNTYLKSRISCLNIWLKVLSEILTQKRLFHMHM